MHVWIGARKAYKMSRVSATGSELMQHQMIQHLCVCLALFAVSALLSLTFVVGHRALAGGHDGHHRLVLLKRHLPVCCLSKQRQEPRKHRAATELHHRMDHRVAHYLALATDCIEAAQQVCGAMNTRYLLIADRPRKS
jgi:hypothetical protein